MRRKLLHDLVILFLAVSGAILAVTLTMGYRATNQISASLIENSTTAAKNDIDTYFESVEKNLLIARKWGQSGMLELSDVPPLNAKFMPILEEMPEMGGIIIARSDGAEYYLRRDGGNWLTRTAPPEEDPGTGKWQRWSGEGKLLASWKKTSGYDPRKRVWFQGALAVEKKEEEKKEKVFWTRPYLFFSLALPGITVSAAWRTEGKQETDTVIGFDVLLNDIFKLVSNLRPTPNGSAFLFTENGSLFTPEPIAPGEGNPQGPTSFLTPAEKIGLPALSGAIKKWKREGRPDHIPVEYLVRGKRWWAGFIPLTEEGRGLWLGVIIPEEDLLGKERWSRTVAALLLILILVAGVLGTFFLVRKYSRHIRDHPNSSLDRNDMEKAVLSLIQEGEGHALEFKSTMRVNLKTGKPEKGIELAWLKAVAAFMNTDGGTLLIGVDDRGAVQGIDADGFASDDKCRLHLKNLIAQHIGIEHSGSLRLEVHTVQDRKIALVECEPSEKPVFLSQGKEESFYIRSGPSSMKLPVSKALQYLENRK